MARDDALRPESRGRAESGGDSDPNVGTMEQASDTISPEEPVFQEIGNDLDLLAWLHDRELDHKAIESLQSVSPENWFALPPAGEQASAGFELLSDTCRMFSEQKDQDLLNELAADYAALYITHAHRASPNESVWMTEDSLTNQEPMFAIRTWYRRYKLSVPNWRERSDDHLVFQLEFLAKLVRMGTPDSLLDAGRFLDQHLMNWIEDFTDSACKNVHTPFYAGLVLITNAYILTLRETLEELTGEIRKPLEENAPVETVIKLTREAYVPGLKPSW